MTYPDLVPLLDHWETYLRAERKASGTIEGYLARTDMYLGWCIDNGHPVQITRRRVAEWMADLLEHNMPSTVITKQVALKRFSWWLAEVEGAVDVDVLAGMTPPKADEPVIEPLSVEEIHRLIEACRRNGRTLRARPFRDVRDELAVRLLAETGMRAGELINMGVNDLNLREGMAVIRRGKGGKGRRVAIGDQTCLAASNWFRKREGHRLAHIGALLLGDGGKGFKYDALRSALAGRAAAAGIEGFHPHRLRHTLAHRWLEAGGSESGLMAQAGWARVEMLARYTKARKEIRAAQEAKKLALGDV